MNSVDLFFGKKMQGFVYYKKTTLQIVILVVIFLNDNGFLG